MYLLIWVDVRMPARARSVTVAALPVDDFSAVYFRREFKQAFGCPPTCLLVKVSKQRSGALLCPLRV